MVLHLLLSLDFVTESNIGNRNTLNYNFILPKLAFYRLVYYLLKPKVKSGMNYWRFILKKN